jgi:hypothetical protein
MATTKWTDLAEAKVFIEKLPNGEFRWTVSKMDGTEIASECEDSIANCLTFIGFAMNEALDNMANRVLHPEWFDNNDGELAFEGAE